MDVHPDDSLSTESQTTQTYVKLVRANAKREARQSPELNEIQRRWYGNLQKRFKPYPTATLSCVCFRVHAMFHLNPNLNVGGVK